MIIKYRGLMFDVMQNSDVYVCKRIYKGYAGNQHQQHYLRTCRLKKRKVNFRDNGHGYMGITMSNGLKRVTIYQHRVVAKAYLHNVDKRREVNHNDSNRSNNSIDNLSWVTYEENMKHAKEFGNINSISTVDFKNIVVDYYDNLLSFRKLVKKYGYSTTNMRRAFKRNSLTPRLNTAYHSFNK